ncbi:MAG: hypothetical protein GYA86_08225 [Firmicutes bacterium]|nr:hypothetical protein [Bacillota bacterium]
MDIEGVVTTRGKNSERFSRWVIALLVVAVSVLGLVFVFDHISKKNNNNVAVTPNESNGAGGNNSSTEPPEESREHFPGGPEDCGFYAGNGQFIECSMNISQVKEILGGPQQEISVNDNYYGDGIDIDYPGLYLAFRPDAAGNSLELILFSIKSTEYTGPRGIKVGDTVRSVLGKFPDDDLDQEITDLFLNAGITSKKDILFNHELIEMSDGSHCHSYGLLHYAQDTDEINSIEFTCGILHSEWFMSLHFGIEKGLVKEIHCYY